MRRRKKRNKYKHKLNIIRFIKVFLLIVLAILMIRFVINITRDRYTKIPMEKVATFNIDENALIHIENFCKLNNKDFYNYLSQYMIYKNFIAKNYSYIELKNILKNPSKLPKINYNDKALKSIYKKMLEDIKCFPVRKKDQLMKEWSYNDTWHAERSYGGDRVHLGTDIMDLQDKPGRLEVVSMCDGTIENIGWLEMGGYRIGIRTSSKTYFYYAHLDSYKDGLKKGMNIKAGDVLGYMGDTGYGAEGTKGKFPVHLHVGIMLDIKVNDDEMWINPYRILKYIEIKKENYQIIE